MAGESNTSDNRPNDNDNNEDEDDDAFDRYAPENRSSATAGSSLTHPRLVMFDEDHTPVTRGGAYEILIKKSCVFCKIAHEDEGRFFAKPVFQNTEVTVFSDISPAAKIHLLVIPNTHIHSIRELKKEHVPLLEYMFAAGAGGLEILDGSINEARVGFHCPPFTSMNHLHMHILYPETSIRWWNKLFFKPDSYWFTLYDTLLTSLNNMEGAPVKSISFPSPTTQTDPEESTKTESKPETSTPNVEVENEDSKVDTEAKPEMNAQKVEIENEDTPSETESKPETSTQKVEIENEDVPAETESKSETTPEVEVENEDESTKTS